MHVKVFEATDMTAGLNMVRKELGPDALIISTRTVKNGKLGVLGKSILEITAATDKRPPSSVTENCVASAPFQDRKAFSAYKSNPKRPAPSSFAATTYAANDELHTQEIDTIEPHTSTPHDCTLPEEFKKELTELKTLVHNLAGEMGRYGKKIDEKSENLSTTELEKNVAVQSLFQNFNNSGDPITNLLLSHGINLKTSTALTTEIRKCFNNEQNISKEEIEETARTIITTLIETPPTHTASNNQRRLAFVGPTGVGKTTTLAKIAAQHLCTISDSIALITIDTYRIAAVEQLKVYGELMNLPVDVVINPRQLDQALFHHRDKDLVLIDTAGRSPRDTFSFDELTTFFLPDFEIENHLVLSATTRESELSEIYRQFNKLNISNMIMTKIDECSELGVILNHHLESKIALSYITNGQRVPEDLIEADQQKIAELIIPISKGITHD